MAIVITGTVIVDESSGNQNPDNTSDASGNDVAFGNLPLTFENILAGLGLDTGAGTTSVAVSGGSDSAPTGDAMITGLPADFTDIAWSDADGIPLDGADSGLDTTDGTSVLLYTYDGGDNNVLLGRAGGATGDIVFAAYLEEVSATEAKVWLVQFASMFNPDAEDPDDPVSPTDVIYVAVSQQIEFSLTGAPSGQNLFMMFGDGTPSTDDVTIVVTGRNPINQSNGGNISDGDTVNTGKGGGDTTLGTNSQQIVEGLALYFTFVKGADTTVTVPNLDQNEADVEANIAFTSLFGASSASFTMAQITSGDQATLEISAYNTPDPNVTPPSGINFIDNLHNNTLVEIDSVTVTTQATKVKGQNVAGETLVFDKDDIGTTPTELSGVTVTFAGVGTVTIQGLDDKDAIEYHTDALHSRVLIDNIGSTDTNFDAAFDIGAFAVTSPVVEPFVFNAMEFQDDGPTLAFGNLVGTGTALAQTGFMYMDPGADGLGDFTLDLNWFSIDGGTTQLTTFTFQEDADFQFSGTLSDADFNQDGIVNDDDPDIDFTLEVDPVNGQYKLTLEGGFGSTVTLDTADGALKAGGPDAVQTLVIPKPPADPLAEIVFFSAIADPLNTAAIQADLDLDEAALEAASPSYIDFARAMNVSTSGIGVANNLLEGDTNAAIGAADESFVVNPDILVSSMEIFVDNSVGGYAFTGTGSKAELLYYRVFYSDDGDATTDDFTDYILVEDDLGLTNKGQEDSFVVDGGARLIDAVQLTMAKGDVKIPHIVLATETVSLASDILLDFTATIYDGDGDLEAPTGPVTSDFSAVLYTNELSGDFDYVLAGTAAAADAFNIDLSSDLESYQVTGFDASTDLRDVLVLIGDATATVQSIELINGDADTLVTINETGTGTTTITVVGVTDLTSADIVFG